MRDVLARLMEWMETSDVEDADIVLRDAITEIAGLRARLGEHRLAIRRLADQDAALSVCEGNVTVTMDATLTAAERAALEYVVARWMLAGAEDRAVLRGLLERTK